LISGHWKNEAVGANDFRRYSPRFRPGNVEKNLELVEGLRKIAEGRNVTVAQLAIAWVLAQGADIVPVIGARRRDRLEEALKAAEVTLTPEDLAALEEVVPKGAAAGERYAPAQMAHLDSEQGRA
jgi:aryl-alcohol dehydrogenase-like predicted oxidoreductase